MNISLILYILVLLYIDRTNPEIGIKSLSYNIWLLNKLWNVLLSHFSIRSQFSHCLFNERSSFIVHSFAFCRQYSLAFAIVYIVIPSPVYGKSMSRSWIEKYIKRYVMFCTFETWISLSIKTTKNFMKVLFPRLFFQLKITLYYH